MINQTDETGLETFAALPRYQSKAAVRSAICNGGPGLLDDIPGCTGEDSFLYVISNTDEQEFDRFIASIPGVCIDPRQNEAGKFRTYRLADRIYYIYYLYADGTVRVIEDNSSDIPAEALSAPGMAERISIYQYSLNYVDACVPYAEQGCMDCGMLYIVRFPDGSLFLVDSGHGVQATERSQEGLYRFLRQISGTPEGEKIRIRAWFFTHAHGDHCGMAATMLGEYYEQGQAEQLGRSYAEELDVEAVLFNFPAYRVAVGTYAPKETAAMKAAMRRNYPDAHYVKLHTGQRFEMFGLAFEVLATWEDSVLPDGSWGLKEFNSTSTVLRLTYGSHSLLMLADTAKALESILLRNYTAQTLRSEIVQVAHHCINNLGIYEVIDADYALVPTAYRLMSIRNAAAYARFQNVCTKGIYCADAVTWELALRPDSMEVFEHPRYDADDQAVHQAG